MKAMILAAGKGTRLQPLTYDMPKPMIPVLGKPVMEYIVDHLAASGITKVMVNLSHKGYQIEQYFGDGTRHGLQMGYSFEGHLDEDDEVVPQPLGSAGALRKIQDFGAFFDEPTLVLCGDAIVDLDIRAAMAEHKAKGALASVIVKEVPWECVGSYGVVESGPDGRIRSFQEKPSQADARSNLASTGIYIFSPEALDLIPADRPFDIGSELFPLLVEAGLPFYAQRHIFNWIDIGKLTDYIDVVMQLMQRPVAGACIPGKQVGPGVWAGLNVKVNWDKVRIQGPVFIGSGTRIEDGAEIVGPAWIGHGCHIGRGARVAHSVLLEYAMVGEQADLERMIVSGRYCVDHAGTTLLANESKSSWSWGDARKRQCALEAQRARSLAQAA